MVDKINYHSFSDIPEFFVLNNLKSYEMFFMHVVVHNIPKPSLVNKFVMFCFAACNPILKSMSIQVLYVLELYLNGVAF